MEMEMMRDFPALGFSRTWKLFLRQFFVYGIAFYCS